MTTLLHHAVRMADWWRGDSRSVEVVDCPSGLVRRSVVTDGDLVIDNDDVLGIATTLTEDYFIRIDVDGTASPITSRVGGYAVFAPGQVANLQFSGKGRFLLLSLSVRSLMNSLAEDFEIKGEDLAFTTKLAQYGPSLEKAMLQAATADEESAYHAVVSCVALLVQRHSSLAGRMQARRSRSMTPMRLRRVLDRVEADLATPLTLLDLAQTAEISPFHFAREFSVATGYAPHQYVLRRRIDRAVHHLAETELPVEIIARQVGFHRASHMSRHMQRVLGLTAKRLRKIL